MAKTYREIPVDVFNQIQRDAGISTKTFDIESFTYAKPDIATSGGFNFTDVPEITDFGEDIDNCPKKSKQLAEITSREMTISFTGVNLTPATAKTYIGSADIDDADETHIIPRDDLTVDDFEDRWFLFPYGDDGVVALHLSNLLSTGGFNFQSTDKAKGTFSCTFSVFYDLAEPDTVPYEIYIIEETEGAKAQ